MGNAIVYLVSLHGGKSGTIQNWYSNSSIDMKEPNDLCNHSQYQIKQSLTFWYSVQLLVAAFNGKPEQSCLIVINKTMVLYSNFYMGGFFSIKLFSHQMGSFFFNNFTKLRGSKIRMQPGKKISFDKI